MDKGMFPSWGGRVVSPINDRRDDDSCTACQGNGDEKGLRHPCNSAEHISERRSRMELVMAAPGKNKIMVPIIMEP